jgi:hypothetical protein
MTSINPFLNPLIQKWDSYQLLLSESAVSPDSLGVSSFSPDICRLLRDFIKLSELTADSGGKIWSKN